jgi:tetratricopeptide (TPR) repeat protein
MIARDNENYIEQSLRSARPWVDEIILIDTGSTDRTPAIAQELGAVVKHFPWCDDFSAARNQSLRYATGDWMFWMDSDDTLPPSSGESLRRTLQSGIPEEVLGLIVQVHCPRNANAPPTKRVGHSNGSGRADSASPMQTSDFNAISANCRVSDPDDSANVTVVDHIKVLRNGIGLQFEGRIHEQVLPSIRRVGGKVLWTDIYVVHSGADNGPEGTRRKLERDLRLLRMEILERPGHPFVLFNLGMTLAHKGEYKEAGEVLRSCIDSSKTGESHLRKAYSLLSGTLENLGNLRDAQRLCWEGLGRYPDDPEIAFMLGRFAMIRQEWEEAISAFGRILRPGKVRNFSSIDIGIKGFKTFANLAICHTHLGEYSEALGAWRACLEHNEGFADAWQGIIELCRDKKHVALLYELIDKYQTVPRARNVVQLCKAVAASIEGGFSNAINDFEIAFQNNQDDFFTLNEYGRFLCENNRWEKSLPILRKLLVLEPSNPSCSYNLGFSLYQLGRCEEAADLLRNSLLLRPKHSSTIDLLARCSSERQ